MDKSVESYLCQDHYNLAKKNGKIGIDFDEEPERDPQTVDCQVFYCSHKAKYRLGISLI